MRRPAKLPLLSVLLPFLVAPFLVAACAADRDSERYSRMYSEAWAPPDRELLERIWKTLEWDGILRHDSDNVHVRTRNGFVTLDGTVRREGTVERLDELIPRVPGVVAVLDLVAVELHYGSDRFQPHWGPISGPSSIEGTWEGTWEPGAW